MGSLGWVTSLWEYAVLQRTTSCRQASSPTNLDEERCIGIMARSVFTWLFGNDEENLYGLWTARQDFLSARQDSHRADSRMRPIRGGDGSSPHIFLLPTRCWGRAVPTSILNQTSKLSLSISTGTSRGDQSSLVINSDFTRAERYVRGCGGTARPPDPKLRRWLRGSKDLDRAILRPVTRTSVDFACRPEAWPELEPHHRAHANRIAGWTYQAHAQSRFGG